uniref:Pentatricopeptide repeat-containing protein At4g13650-like n=1 Tax=Rhizophora mucronata TaxID=61149 RepID=A0A2P2Q2V5_RHIMU
MISMKILRNSCSLLMHLNFCTSSQGPFTAADAYCSSKLLSQYFKAGRIVEAEKLFDGMPHRNTVLWSIAIHGYAINGFHQKSLNLFSQMRNSGLFPNSFTVVGVLVSSVAMRDIMLAKSVHGFIVRSGLESDLIVCTALLDAYAKCGNVFYSFQVFREIEKPSLVACNAMVAGLANNGFCEEAVLLSEKFRRGGLSPNVATILTLIRACISLEIRILCESIHGLIVKLDLVSDISVSNAVLHMYSSLMDLRAATKVFDHMDYKDVVSWTTVMGLLIELGDAPEALKLFCRMRDAGVSNDTVALLHLISACAILGDLKRGRQIHARAIVCGFAPELSLANSIIAMYSKCSDLGSSVAVFDQLSARTLVSWTAMISGFLQNGFPREALNVVIKTRREGYLFDSIMLSSALTACGELASLELCRQLHCYALEAGFSQYKSVLNSLISAYSNCGNVDLAHIVFREMGSLRNVISWNAIINGYGINGHGETALALYNEMRKGGDNPDIATYLCILSACSHSGLTNDGLRIFNQMVKDKIYPSQEHYRCVIDLLVQAGCLTDLSEFDCKAFEDMGPNAWKCFLSRFAVHGSVELAEFAAKRLFEREPGESDQVVALSNVYASMGRFEDAETLRSSMQKRGLIKSPGISCLNGIPFDCG